MYPPRADHAGRQPSRPPSSSGCAALGSEGSVLGHPTRAPSVIEIRAIVRANSESTDEHLVRTTDHVAGDESGSGEIPERPIDDLIGQRERSTTSSDSANEVSLLFKNDAPSEPLPSNASSSSDEGSVPALDVAKRLKELGKQLVALALIQDPVQRAKAAANLYKQYAQVAKDYAGATADGRQAAAAAEASAANGSGDAGASSDSSTAEAAPQNADGERPSTANTATTAEPAASAASVPTTATIAAANANGAPQSAAASATAGATAAVAPSSPQAFIVPGAKSRFVPDLFMEQIKMFAKAAQQIYQSA